MSPIGLVHSKSWTWPRISGSNVAIMPRRNHGSVRESGDQLHDFWNKDFQRSRVAIEEDTAHFIRTLWRAGTSLHNDPDFLAFLIGVDGIMNTTERHSVDGRVAKYPSRRVPTAV